MGKNKFPGAQENAPVAGGYMLHAPESRDQAARVAVAHCTVIALVIAILAVDAHHFSLLTLGMLTSLALWIVALIAVPWGNLSHNWFAKGYWYGASIFVVAAFDFNNPAILLGVYPEAVVLADVYWYRRSALALNLAAVFGAFLLATLLIGGEHVTAALVVALPLMLITALAVGASSHKFVQMQLRQQRFRSTVTALLEALHARDGYTGDHSQETLSMTLAVADQLGLESTVRAELADVALLHDIGKIGIPNAILQKPDRLDDDEWKVMKQHPVIGEKILHDMPGFEHVARAIRHEHERWDGNGYPDQLATEDIPLTSRIVFVCDAFHAMTSDRPYRDAINVEDACAELSDNAGTQFDPKVVEALLQVIESGALDRELTVDEAEDSVATDEYAAATAADGGDTNDEAVALVQLSEARAAVASQLPIANTTNGSAPPDEVSASVSNHDNARRTAAVTDSGLMTRIAVLQWTLTAASTAAYVIASAGLDLFGVAIIAGQLGVIAITVSLKDQDQVRRWFMISSLLAYIVVPVETAYYSEPMMLLMLLMPSNGLAAFFWHRPAFRIAQGALVIVEFCVLPFVIFGFEALPFVTVGARAFPGTIFIVGMLAPQIWAMRFERKRFASTMGSLLMALQARDGYTGEHSEETLSMALRVAEHMHMSEDDRNDLMDVALLHDIGKIGIPDEVLHKPGKLDEHEWEIMRQHPAIGEQIVGQVPGFEGVANAIRHEHERWDGGGYPDGLAGEQIPLASRIVLACDAYHAMTSDRPYRNSIGVEAARQQLVQNAGSQFDPEVVSALLETLDHPSSEFAKSNQNAGVAAAA